MCRYPKDTQTNRPTNKPTDVFFLEIRRFINESTNSRFLSVSYYFSVLPFSHFLKSLTHKLVTKGIPRGFVLTTVCAAVIFFPFRTMADGESKLIIHIYPFNRHDVSRRYHVDKLYVICKAGTYARTFRFLRSLLLYKGKNEHF